MYQISFWNLKSPCGYHPKDEVTRTVFNTGFIGIVQVFTSNFSLVTPVLGFSTGNRNSVITFLLLKNLNYLITLMNILKISI